MAHKTHGNPDDYAKLCHELTHTFGTERRAFDESDVYDAALLAVHQGDYQVAVELIKSVQSKRGDDWRVSAYECGLYDNSDFAQI